MTNIYRTDCHSELRSMHQHSAKGAAAEPIMDKNVSLFDPVTAIMQSGGADYRATSAVM